MTITTQIATDLGAFVSLQKDLIRDQIMIQDETLNHVITYESDAQDGNEIGIPTSQLGEVVQPFQSGFQKKGTLAMGVNKTTQRRAKVDLLIQPDVVVGQWEAHLKLMVANKRSADPAYNEKQARKDMPLVAYIINKVINKVKEDREEQMVYNGEFAAPVAGTPGAAADAVDGFKKVINDAATAAKFVPFVMGAYTSADVFEYLETFLDNIPDKYRNRRLDMFMDPKTFLWYGRDKRSTFQWQQKMEELFKIDFSNINIKPLHSMSGSTKIFATLPGNLTRFIHKSKDADNINIQEFDRDVKVLFDWHECYGIADWRYFWANDQDVPLP